MHQAASTAGATHVNLDKPQHEMAENSSLYDQITCVGFKGTAGVK